MPEVTQHELEGTISLAGRVSRTCVRFAGAYIGTLRHVQKALERAVAGPTSKLRMRMQPFLNSNLVTTQDKLSILQYAAGPRSLAGHLARVQSEIQVARAFKLGDELFRATYAALLRQPEGTFDPGQPGRHFEQAELPRNLGGLNFISLLSLMKPAGAGAMVGILDLLPKCSLLTDLARDPQPWHQSDSQRVSLASSTIRQYLESPYLKHLNVPRTMQMYEAIVDASEEADNQDEPRGNYQKIGSCRDKRAQQFFTTLQCIENKASLMDDAAVCDKVKHRFQIASQYGSGVASMTVATFFKLDLSDVAALQAVCNRLGLALPGLTPQTRCLRNCALMGPNTTLDESTVRESIMTGIHFLGCASCGTYQRHNGILQVLAGFLKREWGFTSCDSTMHGNHVGSSGTSERYTDGQFHGSPHTQNKIAVDVSVVEPNSAGHADAGACKQSFLNVNAGTRVAEKAKTEKYKALCTQRGLTFVPVIFTTSGGIGEQFQRQLWHPHWKRVEEEDLELGIGPWASRRRKQTWLARFGVEIAKCNTRMVSRSQHIVD